MANVTRYAAPTGAMSLSEAVDRLFQDAFTWPRLATSPYAATPSSGFGFNSNLYETDDSYIMQVLLPGVKVDQLEITAHESILTLQGKTEMTVPEGARGIWVGVSNGEFRQQVTLPGEVDADSANADYHDGILTLTLPKSARVKARTIKVGAGHSGAIEGQKS